MAKTGSASGIDLDKLRAALRRLGDESTFFVLDELIDVVPPAKLALLRKGPAQCATAQRL